MVYGDFKDLARRTGSNKVLRDKAFNIQKKSKICWISKSSSSMVYKFFDKKSRGSGVNNKIKQNEQ